MSVRASTRSYTRFTLAMGSSPGFGSTARDYDPLTWVPRPFGLGFPAGAAETALPSPQTVTRRFVLQKARDHARAEAPTRSRSLSAYGFRICFTPLSGVLFTFPSRYWCTIGRMRYLALEGGPPCFRRDVACPAVLPGPTASHTAFPYGTLTHSGRPFQQRSGSSLVSDSLDVSAARPGGPSYPPYPTPAG